MQTIDNHRVIGHRGDPFTTGGATAPVETGSAAGRPGVASQGTHPQRLSAILGASLFAIAGPAILNTIATASLFSLQVLLEIARYGAVAYQIFDR
jgi:hypothetical protein